MGYVFVCCLDVYFSFIPSTHVIPMSYHGRQWCCCVTVRVSRHMSHSVCQDSLCLSHGMTLYIVGVISHDIVFVSSGWS